MARPIAVPTSVTFGSTRTNYARIGHVAQQIFPELLQTIVAIKVPQGRLHSDVSSNGYLVRTLRADEWSMINNARVHGYVNFDIPLTYKLIRNLQIVPPPLRGWDRGYPLTTDITVGDDIERIRQTRNNIIHRGNAKISDSELKCYFNLFKDIAGRLEQHLLKPKDEFVKLFTELETCSMDECTENMYLENLEQLRKREKDLFKEFNQVQDKVNKVHEVINKVQESVGKVQENVDKVEDTNVKVQEEIYQVKEQVDKVHEVVDKVQRNVVKVQENVDKLQEKVEEVQNQVVKVQEKPGCADYLKRTVNAWSKENKNFVKTNIVKEILVCLTNYHVFCLTGKSGIGKSATMQHIALCLSETEGYAIYPCECPSEIKSYYKEGQKKVFLFNDVCGKYTLLQDNVEKWIKQSDSINNVINSGNIKILVTCRTQVFVDSQFQRIELFVKKGCYLSLDKNPLTTSIKIQIAKVYLPEDIVDALKSEIDNYDFLPLMFPMFKSLQRKHTNVDPKAFFNNPFDIYTKEINGLKVSRDKEKFVALFYLVVNNGFIDQSSFEDEENEEVRKTRKNIFEACGLNRETPRQRIREQLDCLLDFLVRKTIISPTHAGYTAMHDKMFDFLCFYFGQTLQKAFIRYAHTKVIIQRTQLKYNTIATKENTIDTEKAFSMDYNGEFSILIDGDNEKTYFERIIKDMSLGLLSASEVLLNHQMKKTVYRKKLLKFMQILDDGIWRKIINLKDEKRCTPLCFLCYLGTHWTCSSGYNNDDDDDDEDDDKEEDYGDDDDLSQDRYNFVKLFLEKGANVNHEDKYRISALKIACQRTDISIVRLLLENGANVNNVDSSGVLPLARACARGNVTLVKVLIEKGADVNPDNKFLVALPMTEGCDYEPSTPDEHQYQHEVVALLLHKGANVNTVDGSGNSPLTNACRCSNITLVKFLLERGARVNVDNDSHNSPLITVCDFYPSTADQHQIAELLLDKGANVNTVDGSGNSPLTNACKRGNITLVKFLLEKGADVNPDNADLRNSPITAACDYNSFTPYRHQHEHQIVQLLLDKGVNVNTVDRAGNSPLTNACKRANMTLVKFLLEKGADVNPDNADLRNSPITAACDYNSFTPYKHQHEHQIVELLLDKGVNVNTVDRAGNSPLTNACKRANITLVKFLLDKGADVNPDNDDLRTSPITAACDFDPSTPDEHQYKYEVIELLFDEGVNVNTVDKSGNSPLTIACKRRNITLVKFLLEKGADVNHDNDGLCNTPITAACVYDPYLPDLHYHQNEVVDLLLDKGANVNTVDKSGDSPLTLACKNSNITLVKLLIGKGADINLDNDDLNNSCITAACDYDPFTDPFYYPYTPYQHQNQTKIVELLLEKGVNINIVDKSGNSPLTNACRQCNFGIVKFLLKRGADVNLKNAGLHHTPLTTACDLDKPKVNYHMIQLLFDHGANINAMNKIGKSALAIAYRRCNLKLIIFLHNKYPGCCQCLSLVNRFVKENQAKSVDDLTRWKQMDLICILEKQDKNRGDKTHFGAIDNSTC